MIDPQTSLAFSIFTNKGVYALLIGSGVSRAAGVPTGWDVVLDLIKKVATLEGDDPGSDPAAWYAERFKEAPGYSSLLGHLAKTQTERNQLMRSYFEPTEEEREQGLKQPTAAHVAIADLVAGGHIRVILTTNFDHLIEDALRARGIEPIVISTPDGIAGALPLTHARVTVYKLHGDYLDTRSMNTEDELGTYDPAVNTLLDRVLDEFGTIVCGWSAEWDLALRAAFERCVSRRFATYWVSRGEPKETAQRLITQRGAEVISKLDADAFFSKLAENVAGLEEYARPHPLSIAAAVATVKRYVAEDRYRIRLFDLVMLEADRLVKELSSATFSFQTPSPTQETLVNRILAFEGQTSMLLGMMVTGCFWSEPQQTHIWQRALSSVGCQTHPWGGMTLWINLSRYPALMLMYGGGIAAIAGGRYDVLATLLEAQIMTPDGQMTAALGLSPWKVIEEPAAGESLPGMNRHFTPLSEHLFEVLREPLRAYLPDDQQYVRCFDRFEYLLGLIHVDQRRELETWTWGPVGMFGWRHRHSPKQSIMQQVAGEIENLGDAWPPLKACLFRGSVERLGETKAEFDGFIERVRQSWY